MKDNTKHTTGEAASALEAIAEIIAAAALRKLAAHRDAAKLATPKLQRQLRKASES